MEKQASEAERFQRANLTKRVFVPIMQHGLMKLTTRLYTLLIILVLLWCVGIIATPLLKHSGWTRSADVLTTFFSRVCHQDESRSFHIEGEKFGVCTRCSALYFGFFLGLLLLPLSRGMKRKHFLPRKFFLFVIFPMILDVLLNTLGFHSSTPMTRVITGALFGIAMPWFLGPILLEACFQLQSRNKYHISDTGVFPHVRKTQ